MPAPSERGRERMVVRRREPRRVEECDAHGKASGYSSRRGARAKTTGAARMSAAKTVK